MEKNLILKTILILLMNSFLLLDIAWAGGVNLSVSENSDTLAAPIQINKTSFFNTAYTINVKPQILTSEKGEMPAELAKLLPRRKVDRWVWNDELNMYIGIYAKDNTEEKKKNLELSGPEEQTSAQLIEKRRIPIFESKRDVILCIGLLATFYVAVMVPLIAGVWNRVYDIFPRMFMSYSICMGGAIAIAAIVSALIIPNLLPWQKIGLALSEIFKSSSTEPEPIVSNKKDQYLLNSQNLDSLPGNLYQEPVQAGKTPEPIAFSEAVKSLDKGLLENNLLLFNLKLIAASL
ncbi:MAG: hypothetical protein V1739_08970 [Candidatus Omnitrophota bacterium]